MKLPEKMDGLSAENRRVLGEFYNDHANKQWFNRAEIVIDSTENRRVLEIIANNNPLLEMKDILGFAQKYNLKVQVIDLSHSN